MVPDPFGPFPEPPPAVDPAAWLGALDVPELREVIMDGFNSLEVDSQERVLRQTSRPEFNDRAVSLFGMAGGWRHAESLGRGLILPRAPTFSPDQIRAVIKAVTENDQIWDAAGMESIITQFFRSVRHQHNSTKDDWKKMLAFLNTHQCDWTGIAATAQEEGW